MNSEQREHEITQIILATCARLGVRVAEAEVELDAPNGASLSWQHRYDLGYGLRQRQERALIAAVVSGWLAGITVTAGLLLDKYVWTAFVAGGVVAAALVFALYAWCTIRHERPVSEGALEDAVYTALRNAGYTVQLGNYGISVYWRRDEE